LFISELNIFFNELEDLNNSLSEEEKFNYLCTSISRELAIETNLILYNERWGEASEHLKKVIPKMKYLN